MSEIVRFTVSAEEKKKIEDLAEKLGISVSAFMRLLVKNWSDGIKFEPKQTIGKK